MIARDLNEMMERTTTIPLYTSSNPVDYPPPALFGQDSMCTTREETANLIAVIIADQLGHNDVQKSDLATALQNYFAVTQVDNNKQLTILDDDDWSGDVLKSPEH